MFYEKASSSDIDDIMFLEKNGFANGIAETSDVFSKRIEIFPDGFLIARKSLDSDPVGYICSELLSHTEDESVFKINHSIEDFHTIDGDELYISSMTICPLYRGYGIGRNLFKELISRISLKYPNVSAVILLVNENWKHAINIYVGEGFVEVKRIDGFFTPYGTKSENAIMMRKGLKID